MKMPGLLVAIHRGSHGGGRNAAQQGGAAVRKLRIALALTASACALLVVPAFAGAATPGNIKGKVTNASSGDPISSLHVCAYKAATHESAGCQYTDGNGEYMISGLEAGSYKVEFVGSEYYEGGYFTQWYNGKPSFETANPVAVTEGNTTTGINAAMQEKGGKISGTVTDATTGGPINGIEVCARATSSELYSYSECARTNASGQYTVSHLPSNSYRVGFFSPYKYNETTEEEELDGPNYVAQYYNGKVHGQEADPVAVSDGTIASGINAAMQPGATITGTVTDAVTGAALRGVSVCAWGSINHYCDGTDSSGHYFINAVATGSYKVEFDPEHFFLKNSEYQNGQEHWLRSDFPLADYLRQYYNDKFSFEAAEPIAATGGATTAGIDAKMTKEIQPPPPAGIATVGAKAKVKGGKALLQLKCTGAGACSGVVKLTTSSKGKKGPRKQKASKSVLIGHASFSIPAGKSKVVRVKLNGKGKALLQQAGNKGLKVKVTGKGVKKRTVTLKGAQRSKKKKK